MFPRHLAARLLEALRDTPAVLLAGGRQTGKTTLARGLIERGFAARYVTLDDPTQRAAAEADPVTFLSVQGDAVVLDEVQQAPALFPVLRREIDRDRRPGRFILTGSAQVLAVPELAEFLVGRMEVQRLWPLSQGEIGRVKEGFIDAVFRSRLPVPSSTEPRATLFQRVLRGCYPEAVERSIARRSAWFRSYVELLLQRDVRDLAEIDRLTSLPRLLELLAARAGSLTNFAELSRSAGIPQTSLKRYFALLEGVFLVVRLPAWAANPSKRITKSPKLYLADTGLLAQLLRLTSDALRDRPSAFGQLLENFVVMELTKQLGWSRIPCRLHHFRTTAGREVDIVLEDDRGRLVGIEVKSAASVSRSDFIGLDVFAEMAGPSFHRGVVLYSGADVVPFGPRLHALPIDSLWTLEASEVQHPIPS